MGKSQTKKKTRGERHNPMRVPDTHLGGGKGEGKADPAKEKEMLPIFTKLKSAEYADRTWACAAICNLIQNDPATRRLFQANNIVGALLERLSDSVDEVVVEASGALRNLAIDGGHEMCAEMFNKGIMSHLTVLIAKITSTIDSIVLPASANADKSSDADFQARKHLLGLTENVIALIWCLAEANHKTLAAVNAAQVQGLLLRAVTGREVLGQGVALAAAHALYSLSQDNYPFTRSILATPAVLPELVNVVQKEHTMAESGKKKGKCKAKDQDDGRALLTRVLVAGALRNFVLPGSKADELVDIVALTNSTILPLVNSLLDIDVSSTVSQVMELVAHAPSQDVANLAKGMNTDHRSDAEVALERIERKLTTVSVGLEILTGICAGLEDVQVDDATAEETAPADDDEEMEDDDAELADDALIDMARDSAVEDTKTVAPTVNTAVTLQYLLATLQLPQRLTSLSLLNNLSFPPTTASPSPHAPTTSALSVLHLRALEALNNLLLTVVASIPPEDAASRSQVGNVIPVKGVWDGVFSIVTLIRSEPQALDMKGQELRRDVMEMALGCIWGLAKIAPEAVGVTTEQEQLLIDTLGSLRGENSRTQCVETIAALASRQNVPLEENKVIGTWLVSQLSPSVTFPTDTLMAVINALIDIYADETREYDQVFVQGGFLQSLTSCVARVKGEVRKIDRRKNLALRAVAEEVYENLAAFVKYRRGLARS